jgi:hypothetical protein
VLTLTDILDEDFVDVEVLRNVFLADGNAADLDVGLVAGTTAVHRCVETAASASPSRIVVGSSRSRSAPRGPHGHGVRVHLVPGRDDALPQLRLDAPDVQVESGQEVVLDLDDYVIAASGRPVRITDTATVRASHSDGTDLVVDEDTLRFRSEPGYFGPRHSRSRSPTASPPPIRRGAPARSSSRSTSNPPRTSRLRSPAA